MPFSSEYMNEDCANPAACGQPVRIALAMGDPAGIAPELTAKLLADDELRAAAAFLVLGDHRILAQGARVAGVPLDVAVRRGDDLLTKGDIPSLRKGDALLLDAGHLAPEEIEMGQISRSGGAFALHNFRNAIILAATGHADAVMFTPFNKAAMRLAHPGYEDEIAFTAHVLGFAGKASEFNILPKVWNARVTSHMPVKDVARAITQAAILENLHLTDAAMREAGFTRPRIAVAGLNPHAGDGGSFGREEIDIIAPAIHAAQQSGLACEGPFPPDTVFLRAIRGDCDAVLTMYHDQGQIAMKLIGFDAGVTLLGGFPFPLVTPAHGSAYDIAGKGIANIGATRNAALLAARMAHSARRNAHPFAEACLPPRIAAE